MEKRRGLIACLIFAACHSAEAPAPDHVAEYRAVALERRSGVYPFVYDRSGKPLSTNADFKVITDILASKRVGLRERVTTTFDANVQHAALAALGDLKGSLVAIDPRTNEVLAIASTAPDPLERQYEPGSVIKTLTLLAALSNGVNVQFPYECKGYLEIDGRRFGDWHPGGHGKLPELDEALAQSCNVVFADIGLRTGVDKLRDFHRRAGFDGNANLGLFTVPLGKTVGSIFNNFETGFYSIGLEHETITTFHLAMLASMLANRGALTTPRLYTERRPFIGEAGRLPNPATEQLVPRAIAERVVIAMQAVVTRDKGTGRRAAVEGVSLALKTGTAGTEEQGYDALLLGFAPADQPKIAFALIAENAGSAEIAAAKVAHDFITLIIESNVGERSAQGGALSHGLDSGAALGRERGADRSQPARRRGDPSLARESRIVGDADLPELRRHLRAVRSAPLDRAGAARRQGAGVRLPLGDRVQRPPRRSGAVAERVPADSDQAPGRGATGSGRVAEYSLKIPSSTFRFTSSNPAARSASRITSGRTQSRVVSQ